MLYDNALLSRVYLHAYQVSGDPFFRRVVEETLDYVLREMTCVGPTPDACGFYSTQDADSEGEEGKFFVWTPDEVDALLGGAMSRYPRAFGQALSALDAYLATTQEIVIIGDPQEAATQALLETVHGLYLPNKLLVVARPEQVDGLSQCIPLLAGRTQIDESATVYVCENYTCQLPVTEPEALRAQLG